MRKNGEVMKREEIVRMNDENSDDNQGGMRWFIGKATQKKARKIVVAYCCSDLVFTMLAVCGLLEFRWISVFALWFARHVPPLRPMIDLSPPSTLNLAVCIFISACLTGIAVFVVFVSAFEEFVEDFRHSRLKHRLQKLLLFPVIPVIGWHVMSSIHDLGNGFSRTTVSGKIMYLSDIGMGIYGGTGFIMFSFGAIIPVMYIIVQVVIFWRWMYEKN